MHEVHCLGSSRSLNAMPLLDGRGSELLQAGQAFDAAPPLD